MKKTIALALILVMVLTLAACGEKELTPIEKAQNKIVEIGEQYLNYELTSEEAREKLESIRVPETEEGHGQLSLEVDRDFLVFLLVKPNSTYEEIEEKVNWIREHDYTRDGVIITTENQD